jgi:hypothetical protein
MQKEMKYKKLNRKGCYRALKIKRIKEQQFYEGVCQKI